MNEDTLNTRLIGVITSSLHGKSDGINSIIDAMSHPDIAIISMTITEKGYCHKPATGDLDTNHPDIIHDIARPDSPRSLPGIILAAIRRRKQYNLPPFSVMSCDNIPNNGKVTSQVILQLANQQDINLSRYIQQYVTFPSTMVDRIVPAMTEDAFKSLTSRIGCDDPVAVESEPFFQWVIEDNFSSGRPKWEYAGAELVKDVLPFEKMKLRMLNGSHSFLAYLGFLSGYEYISDCMSDITLRSAAYKLMIKEQAPTVQISGINLEVYANSLIERYKNRAIKHRTYQIATDGTQKMPQRLLDSIRWHLINESIQYDLLLLGVAAWMRYITGIDEQGNEIKIKDPLHVELSRILLENSTIESRVKALLGVDCIFGDDFSQNQCIVLKLISLWEILNSHGAKATVKYVLSKIKY
jgi:fructuronate reductase